MDAKELRIGNLVYNNVGSNKNEVVIEVIEYVMTSILNESLNPYRPIPLTEEWLEKFGFEENENGTAYPKYDYWKKDCLGWNLTWTSGNLEWQILNQVDSKQRPQLCIKYVHQLQNLYFTLTGEELKTKQHATLNK